MNLILPKSLPLRLLILATLLACSSPVSNGAVAPGQRGIVATVHPLATEAGINAMKRGGNAVDAAIAVALTLGVVDGHNSGIGGGCIMTIRLANGRFITIDGREMAPLAATRNMYIRNGVADPRLSQFGPLAVGVPGSLAAYEYASVQFGRLPLRELLLSAAKLAEEGFKLDATYAQRLSISAAELRSYTPAKGLFFNPDGQPKKEGDLLQQPDLARSYRSIATQGVRWFYNGPFCASVGEWMLGNGGVLIAADFQLYQIRLRDPILTTYRGYTIAGFPPPSSGGVHVAEILNILENFDLKQMGANSANAVHVITEAMKLAFADRASWLGDPDFTRVPRSLISKPYAARLAKRIQLDRATPVAGHGSPPGVAQDYFRQHTTHFSTADAQGNWVACTATLNTSFGSKVIVPGTGVVLNNQMDDFSIQPGMPNFFGLIEAEANSIAPRKRPLTSMSPTIVLKDGKPLMSLGAAGGPTIISQTLLTILNRIDFGMDLETALLQARFHHQWRPDELKVEAKMPPEVIGDLRRRGHKVVTVESLGATQAVALGPEGQGFIGAHDPRVAGKADGF
jgi:gamma-glutamyltranspeptidase/glutathione hydrolase